MADEPLDCAAVCAELGLDPEYICCAPCHWETEEEGNALDTYYLRDGREATICCAVEGELLDRGLLDG